MVADRLIIACLVASVACGAPKPRPVEYSVSAEQNYDRGMAELGHKEWAAASQYFAFIVKMFPYSKYELLAELGQADIELATKHCREAIASYRRFIAANPSHELVENGSVASRIGEASACAPR